MSALVLKVELSGIDAVAADVQRMRNALSDRGPLHAQMAVDVRDFTRDYLAADDNHATAEALGATPTGFRKKSGAGIEADSDDQNAILRIPRNTGLGRAFHDIDIIARDKLLTQACHALTYGRSARDFPEGVLEFAIVEERFPALVFAASGETAYWLRRKVHQKQDRTLLPSDEDFTDVALRSARVYLTNILLHLPS